ncbi:hypothetical protein B0I35DRAFT_422378 [Stachybotrys elegans]|uniref:Cell wall biogenesis protein Mhp1 n=1 Tax=Stachybotrys elegans TaxID=80388 RepID=A0A8K0T4G1_9HYPO|nr:hypothetical protein B0I35DRAFT_422378 [Stachybotrys elegans]
MQNGQHTDIPRSSSPTPSSVSKRLSRSGSIDRPSPSPQPRERKGSWLSNISSKFSTSSPPASPVPVQQEPRTNSPPSVREDEIPVPRLAPNKNAVLQHATRHEGDAPYTPAPPKNGQAGLFGVLRRLSSSNGSKFGHGLVERKVLNVDRHRERCPIMELNGAKLKRVAFCVDVEIAPQPKYPEPRARSRSRSADQAPYRAMTEKGEADALKSPKLAEEHKETEGVSTTGEPLSKEPEQEGAASTVELAKPETDKSTSQDQPQEKDTTRKKEKKKRSEEERKARKEKKRKLAESNGFIPMEIHYDTTDSSEADGATKTFSAADPVRIYRRCCQLREGPILKKITEQLLDSSNFSETTGMVHKLDLTDYRMELPDLITLGDYLAVVPIREVVLENAGLSDEGLRVILAGLLAARRSEPARRKPKHELEEQGGVIERLVLKNNKIGPDGWKHLSLFLYMCRSLKHLDISSIPFPRQTAVPKSCSALNIPRSIADVLSKSIAERLGGANLELLNLGDAELSMEQLGTIVDGVILCGIPRLGLGNNYLDHQGVAHVARYLATGKCEGIDLGGNDLREHLGTIAASIKETDKLWAMSLADCNLTPSSLCKIIPILSKLNDFRFIDLSHNVELFQADQSAVGLLRRYLPKMQHLKRIHLQNVNMSAEDAIALSEVLPEVCNLAHINLLGNQRLSQLANAKTAEAQEEACALYASLMAAARVSKSLVCVDIEVPSDQAGELVKAMAKQVVAYCLRNMEHIPDAQTGASDAKAADYPDVLAHLVGQDAMIPDMGDFESSAPDEDYVIGGTGVVKALTCCLKNRGNDNRRESGDFLKDVEDGATSHTELATSGKAKDMSKHLLAGARNIHQRLQPALRKALAHPEDEYHLRKLQFLENTLKGIIKRFEDEFPDTRQMPEEGVPLFQVSSRSSRSSGRSSGQGTPPAREPSPGASDGEDENKLQPERSVVRKTSRLLNEEEGRVHRAGHRLGTGVFETEQFNLVSTIDSMGTSPNVVRVLMDVAEDLGGEFLEKAKEKGPLRAFKEDRSAWMKSMKESDPDHWPQFLEAQQKTQENTKMLSNEEAVSD